MILRASAATGALLASRQRIEAQASGLATVSAMRARHPALDDADARILLGLVQLAYRELGTRAAVEDAVLRSLGTDEGLSLLGEEGTLSDLWIRGRPTAEQPIVTFVLKLFF